LNTPKYIALFKRITIGKSIHTPFLAMWSELSWPEAMDVLDVYAALHMIQLNM
jgi:hypothetical protein